MLFRGIMQRLYILTLIPKQNFPGGNSQDESANMDEEDEVMDDEDIELDDEELNVSRATSGGPSESDSANTNNKNTGSTGNEADEALD
jgi:hypothetical protein